LFFGIFFLFSLFLFAIFPAFLVGRQKVISFIRGRVKQGNSQYWLKNSLIIFQFFISAVLIISSIMLNRQYRYMLQTDCGFDKENIIYIPLSPESSEKKDYLEQEFEKHSLTKEVAFGSNVFGSVANHWGRNLYYQGEQLNIGFDVMFVCPDFFRLFDLKMGRGKYFNENSSGRQDVIFNQTFVKKYNIDKPLETKINQGNNRGSVIGVVKDFNYNSMRDPIGPMGFVCIKNWTDILFVKFSNGSFSAIQNTLSQFEKKWNEVSPNYPFEYHFMDSHFENVYRSEMHMMKILTTASLLAIIIAGLGLFGMAYYATNKRIKEIGIRKVNGAKIREIVALLNLDFVIKVMVAFIIACPVVYLLIEKWLQSYAFRASISWWIFLAGGTCVIIIALLTVSWQSWRVARRNPVEALRDE